MKKVLIILTALSSFVLAQNILTLEEAVNIALRNNVNVGIAKNSYAMAENNIHIGNAGFLPRFDLSLSSTYNDNYMMIMGNKNYNSYTANIIAVKASYILFDGMRNFATFAKLKYAGAQAFYGERATAENIVLQVIQLYNQIALLQENQNIALESMEISRERLRRQKAKEEFGQQSSVDYLSAVVDFNKDSLNYIYVVTQLSQAKQNLNRLLNRDINTDFTVKDVVSYREIPDKEEILRLARANNTSLKSALEQRNISQEEKKIVNSAFYPTLKLESAYGYNTLPEEFSVDFSDPNKTFYAGISLQYNLFNGFQNKIQSQNAELALKNAELAVREAELSLETEVSNAYVEYVNAKVALELEKTSLETSRLNFERMREMYDLGKVTLTQFREAQLKFISAKLRISELKFSIKNNEAKLLKLAGLLLPD